MSSIYNAHTYPGYSKTEQYAIVGIYGKGTDPEKHRAAAVQSVPYLRNRKKVGYSSPISFGRAF